jgi:hypothetical protein
LNILLDLQHKLGDAGSAIAQLEKRLAQAPSRSISANLLSLKKLQANLQAEFATAASDVGLEICRYRVLNDRPPAKLLGGSILRFQDAFAQTFESLRSGVRNTRKIAVGRLQQSELQAAYGFMGSFGLAFTIPNDRLLFDLPTQLDRTAEMLLEIASSAPTSGVIQKAVKTLGRAPIAAVYDWAKLNTEYGSGAGIEWIRGDTTKISATIQAEQFAALTAELERTSESSSEPIRLFGTLVGADTDARRFHFVTDEGESIRGTFEHAISDDLKADLPSRYHAVLTRTVEIKLATEVEIESFFLERLDLK